MRPRHRIPSDSRQPTMPGSFPEDPLFLRARSPQDGRATATRPTLHIQSSPPSPPSRGGHHGNPVISLPESLRPRKPTYVPPRPDFQSSTGHSNNNHIAQLTHGSQLTQYWQIPESQITRSASQKSSLHPPPVHFRPRAHSSMDIHPTSETSTLTPNLNHKHSSSDGHGNYGAHAVEEAIDAFEPSPSITPSILSEEFGHFNLGETAANGLSSANGLERFHNGEGDDNDWAWHLLVTKEARESLPLPEVLRQSAIFDLISGERSYVSDMELVQEVFVGGLFKASPPVLPPSKLDGFVREVFWNMDRILAHHRRMLASLFDLQREQHPILLNIGDLILDTVLKFQPEYDSYIKHYPLAESCHRRELKSNPRYRAFIEQCSHDSRLGKRDLITFISRPVTRLPRLSLQLVEVKKRTENLNKVEGVDEKDPYDEHHPDLETIAIVVDVLNRFVKNTQPGIEASEGKVKFYALRESIKLANAEIIDMDLYDENRTLIHSGPLARKQRSDNWSGWTDLEVALLDNYVLFTKPNMRTGRKDVVSRPIPLEYLRLGSFNGPPENRREERSEGGGLFDTIIKPTRPVFPFVLHHASAPARRYTLYANSENGRQKWRESFVNALGIKKVVMDANKWFAMNSINDGYFRMRTRLVPGAHTGPFTGKICSAVAFASGGKNIIAVGTPTGLYVGVRGQSSYNKVLSMGYIAFMSAMQGFNKLLILHNGSLMAYSLDILARVGQGLASSQSLDASLQRLGKPSNDGAIIFFRVGTMAGRTVVVYACKGFLSSTLHILEAVADQPMHTLQKIRSHPQPQTNSLPFRPYGEPFYVPKEPSDVTLLAKTIAVSTERLMTVVDPTNLTGQPPVCIPDFSDMHDYETSTNSPIASLKAKCESAKPIGIVRSGKEELFVIYDEFGCYVTKHAVPARNGGYVRWETKATTYTQCGIHVLLFSPGFLEIRHVFTGRLVQVLEGEDIRLLQSPPNGPLLIAMRGKKDDEDGMSDALIELVETAPIETPRFTPVAGFSGHSNSLWDEWD